MTQRQKRLISDSTPWTITAEQMHTSAVYRAAPLSSFATRLARIESYLEKLRPVHLTEQVDEVEKRWKAANSGGAKIEVWNPVDDYFTPTRGLSRFLPAQDGGLEPTRGVLIVNRSVFPKMSHADFSKSPQVWPLADLVTKASGGLEPPPGLPLAERGEARQTFLLMYASEFGETQVKANSIRDRILQGQTTQAVTELTNRKDRIDSQVEAIRQDRTLERQVVETGQRLDVADATASRVARGNDPVVISESQRRLDDARREFRVAAKSLALREAGPPIASTTLYEIALSIHERCERLELNPRSTPEQRVEGWKNAEDWWRRYLQSYPANHQRPSVQQRDVQARQLLQRSQEKIRGSTKEKT